VLSWYPWLYFPCFQLPMVNKKGEHSTIRYFEREHERKWWLRKWREGKVGIYSARKDVEICWWLGSLRKMRYSLDIQMNYLIRKLNLSLFFLNKILLGNIHYTGGFTVTNPIRLVLYIISIAPITSPTQPPPTPLKAIARGFLVLFHIGIWSPSTTYHHLNLLPSPYPSPPSH
jgi:hypothetical protein